MERLRSGHNIGLGLWLPLGNTGLSQRSRKRSPPDERFRQGRSFERESLLATLLETAMRTKAYIALEHSTAKRHACFGKLIRSGPDGYCLRAFGERVFVERDLRQT